jgi:hypothetical protein
MDGTCNIHGINEIYIENIVGKISREEFIWKTWMWMGGERILDK